MQTEDAKERDGDVEKEEEEEKVVKEQASLKGKKTCYEFRWRDRGS